MSFDGYLTLDGTEIGNRQRFETYAGTRSWFNPLYREDGIGFALESTYTDVETDVAPWWDPDVPASLDLFGFYPANITGLDDGSGTVSTVESTRHGGVPGRVRFATKEVNVTGFIAGASEAAVEYGLIWLRRVLLGGVCSPLDARRQALGTEMTFLGRKPPTAAQASEQDMSPQQVRDAITRTYRGTVNSVPVQVLSRRQLACGDFIAQVQFGFRIGDPSVYSNTTRVFVSLFDTPVWGIGVEAGTVDETTFTETLCGNPLWAPLYDPLCAAAVTPPSPPNVPLGCWDPPAEDATFDRTVVTIPASNFETFTEMLPIITLTSGLDAVRDIRFRFYPDPNEDLDLDANPCEWVSDIVLSFMPAGTLVIDASYQQAHITTSGGNTRRADSLIFATDQRPVTWPVLDCGVQYLLAIDVLGTDDPPVMDLDIVARSV
jgi:hypothetical protein